MADEVGTSTPGKDQDVPPSDAQRYLATLRTEEVFNIGQSQGRILERLDAQDKRMDDLKTSINAMDGKVSRLIREFGFIKKAWWIGLIAVGFMLAKLTEYLPTILSRPPG